MSRLLAIDPGLRNMGVAVFEDGTLVFADNIKGSPATELSDAIYDMAKAVISLEELKGVTEVVSELPQIYRVSKGDPNDLINICLPACIVIGHTKLKPTLVYPRQWKGQLPANVCAGRILTKLTEKEREAIDWLESFENTLKKCVKEGREIGGVKHNAIDAVGIGLYHLGRFGKNNFRKG